MVGIPIPALRLKLRFLRDHGPYKVWQELADEFSVKAKTAYWWGHGDQDRKPNMLPSKHYPTLLKIINDQFRNQLTEPELKKLIKDSYSDWEEAFKAYRGPLISVLLEKEAVVSDARLFLKPKPAAGLIETDLSDPKPEPKLIVKKDTWFRLEFVTQSTKSYYFALQHAGKSWGEVPLSFDADTRQVYLPARKKNGKYGYMIERRDVGVEHSFIIFQTPKPVPLDIKRYLKEDIKFDGKGLSKLATFFENQKEDKRHIYLIKLKVEE